MSGWIGVDLDGTLAKYGSWIGPDHIGDPIWPMVERVKVWLAAGYEVRIFTARAWLPDGAIDEVRRQHHQHMEAIKDWLEFDCGLPRLQITNQKDYGMIELFDDRAVQVEMNTGRLIGA